MYPQFGQILMGCHTNLPFKIPAQMVNILGYLPTGYTSDAAAARWQRSDNSPHKASAEQAYHVLEIIDALFKSSACKTFVKIESRF